MKGSGVYKCGTCGRSGTKSLFATIHLCNRCSKRTGEGAAAPNEPSTLEDLAEKFRRITEGLDVYLEHSPHPTQLKNHIKMAIQAAIDVNVAAERRRAEELVRALEWYSDDQNYNEDGAPGRNVWSPDTSNGPAEADWECDGGERAEATLARWKGSQK